MFMSRKTRTKAGLAFKNKVARPVRIGVTGLRGIPDVMGGIESHCRELLPRIKSLRPDYEIFILGRAPYLNSRSYIYQGISVQGLYTIKNKYLETVVHTFLSVLYARYILRCTILHIHGIGPSLMAPFAAILGLTVIVTHHGDDYNRRKWNLIARTALRIGEFFAIRYSSALIVVSNYVTERLKQDYSDAQKRIFYIPNGAASIQRQGSDLDDQRFLASLNLKSKSYVLTVGRLVPEKNIDVLIEAFEKTNIKYDLVIAGAADHEDSYAKTLLKKSNRRVRFLGQRSREDLSILYRSASLFVLASSHEGLPIAALEALAAGCPVVLSNIPANLEVGLPAANYFEVDSPNHLTVKLLQSHSDFYIDPKIAISKFQWKSIAAKTSCIYDSLLE